MPTIYVPIGGCGRFPAPEERDQRRKQRWEKAGKFTRFFVGACMAGSAISLRPTRFYLFCVRLGHPFANTNLLTPKSPPSHTLRD